LGEEFTVEQCRCTRVISGFDFDSRAQQACERGGFRAWKLILNPGDDVF
jgi:hypothetical protein